MSHREKRQLVIDDANGGGSVTLGRDGDEVRIVQVMLYRNHNGLDAPIELDTVDRLALIDFLNMGEYVRKEVT